MTEALVIGTTLDDKYRIERLLGSGGMGAVYAGEDVRNGQRVAVKIIQTKLPADAADLVARFEREARAAGSIDTEHIARCVGAGTDPASGQPYMVLELLEGEDLQRVLHRTGPIAPDLALRITAQACFGLQRAHEANVVHRDIKPANLFLAKRAGTDEVVVKILDFGVAKIITDPGEDAAHGDGLTRTGSLLGSPLYMSPEQARSVKKVDGRADLWSLGVVLYKALAGRTPFDHISAIGDMILALWSEPPTPVQQFAPWVPPEIAAVVDRMLQIEPNDRFQSATEVLAALTPLLEGGTAIHESMLVPIPAGLRERSAPLFFRRFDTRPRPLDRPRTDPAPVRAITASPPSNIGFSDDSASRKAQDSAVRAASVVSSDATSPSDSAVRGTSSPGGVTQNGLAAAGSPEPPARGSLGIKAVAVAAVGLAIGLGAALLISSRSTSGTPPALSATSVTATPTVASGAPPPAVTPAEEPTSTPSATASATATAALPPTSIASAAPSGVPQVRPNVVPTAHPKATATASASAAPKFTDFGDRK